MQTLSYSNVKYTPMVPLILLIVEKIKRENFDFVLLSFPSCITQELYSIYERSTHQTTVLLLEISLFLVRAACELRSMRYGSKHASRSLSCMPFNFVRTYTHNSKTKGRIRTFYLTNDCSTIGKIYFLV